MAAKKGIQVLIGGKIYNLSGYESEEYLQKIALYINNKMAELETTLNYRRSTSDMQRLMLEMNIADDYHKAKNQIDFLEAELNAKNKSTYELKQDIVEAEMQLEKKNKEIENHKAEINDLQKQIAKLEVRANIR